MYLRDICPALKGDRERAKRMVQTFKRNKRDVSMWRSLLGGGPLADIEIQERKIQEEKTNLIRERIVTAKDLLKDILPECTDLTAGKPDVEKTRTKQAQAERQKQTSSAREILPLAPQITTFFGLNEWMMSHNKQNLGKPMPLKRMFDLPNLGPYTLDPASWSTKQPEDDESADRLNKSQVKSMQMDARDIRKLEEALRATIQPATYAHVFWSATMKVADQAQAIIKKGVNINDPNQCRDFIDQMAAKLNLLESMGIACDCSLMDYTQTIVTILSNLMLSRRDNALSKPKPQLRSDDLQKIRG